MPIPLLTLALDTHIPRHLLPQLINNGVDAIKVGPWSLLTQDRQQLGKTVAQVAEELCDTHGIPVFLDIKLADTSDTNRAVIDTLSLGIGYVTISTPLYTPADLQKMVEHCVQRRITPVAVPILSSTERPTLLPNVSREGFFLSELARLIECGFTDIVCDARSLLYLKGTKVRGHTVGIRPVWHNQPNNHQHTATPTEAIRAGAYNLVMGRALTSPCTDGGIINALSLVRAEIRATQ